MNVETGNEAAQFHFWEYINRSFYAVQGALDEGMLWKKYENRTCG
jgi:hypothetical protein